MKIVQVLSVGFPVVAMLLVGCKSHQHANAIRLDQTPPAVQESIQKLTAGAKIEKIKSESEDGQWVYEWVYEVEYEVKDVDHSAEIGADGTVLEEETEIAPADLPSAVTQAVHAKYAGETIKEASLVRAKDKEFYEVEFKTSAGKRELQIASDGTVQSDQLKARK